MSRQGDERQGVTMLEFKHRLSLKYNIFALYFEINGILKGVKKVKFVFLKFLC